MLVQSTEAVGPTFATGSGTGGLEMKIDSTTYYNGVFQPGLSWSLKHLRPWCDNFFDFDDIKPGDTGTTTISIHIKKNPAYVCLDFQNVKDQENSRNEPEREVDGNRRGEMSSELEFFAWYDDGDNFFEVGEVPLFGTDAQSAKVVLKGKTYALADKNHGTPFRPNQTKYVGISWCAGNLEVDLSTALITCDAEAMGNEAQTDSMTFDVSLRAVSSKQQPWFTCVKEDKPPHGGHDDYDDNHHDDDDHTAWHWKKPEYNPWPKFKNYCVNTWNKWRGKYS